MSTTVLLGFAEAISAPEVVWSLADSGFRPVAFARKGRCSALRHSRHVKIHEITPPETDAKAALADLQAVLNSVRTAGGKEPTVLFPLDDAAVWLTSRLPLEAGCVLAGPTGKAAKLALDKSIQIEAARAAGFNVLPTRIARSAAEILAQEKLPAIIKSAGAVNEAGTRLGKGKFWICETRAELENAAKQWTDGPPVLVQDFVTGVGEGIFGLAGANGVQAWSAHRRLRMMNPHGSGSSAAISQTLAPELKEAAERFIQQTGWRGIFMIELLRDSAEKVWFMEFNGRSWGSMALSRRQGLEYPSWNAQLVLDPVFCVPQNITGASGVVCRNLGRELMHLLFVLRGPKSHALRRQWPSFWGALRDVVFVRRSDCFYNWRKGDLKVFASDSYYTVRNGVFKSKE
jgi:predicted ATP-grasp superfamily ATP-dependent carboligase